MQETKLENGTTTESLNPREFQKKRTILRAKTSLGKPKQKIFKQHSDAPFRKKVVFADTTSQPIHTVISFEPFRYEKEYTFEAITKNKPEKKSKGCACLIF